MVGRPAADNRRFVLEVLWVLRSGMRWQDMPELYGKYKSTHKRFTRWAATGVGQDLSRSVGEPENRYRMIDSCWRARPTSRRPRREKKGLQRPLWGGVEEV